MLYVRDPHAWVFLAHLHFLVTLRRLFEAIYSAKGGETNSIQLKLIYYNKSYISNAVYLQIKYIYINLMIFFYDVLKWTSMVSDTEWKLNVFCLRISIGGCSGCWLGIGFSEYPSAKVNYHTWGKAIHRQW